MASATSASLRCLAMAQCHVSAAVDLRPHDIFGLPVQAAVLQDDGHAVPMGGRGGDGGAGCRSSL